TSSVTWSKCAPTVATAAASSPTLLAALPISDLTVLGADDGGESHLTYTWGVTAGPSGVTFGANGTNAAKSSTATFTQAGTYTFRVTIADQDGVTVTSSVVVPVQQHATSRASSTAGATVAASGSEAVNTRTTAELSVLGAGVGGGSHLTYTWAVTAGPSGVTFGANGTNAAKSSTATFTQAGTYTFRVTIADQDGVTVTSSVVVPVQQH